MATATTVTTKDRKLSAVQNRAFTKLPSKSAKIRYLLKLGWSRRQVADRVGVIYQFVYNVEHQKAK